MRHLTIVLGLCLAATAIVYSAETTTFTDAQRSFWSLQPVQKPAVPAVKNRAWISNPIDAFVLARLEEKQLEPNKPADKVTLLRRVTIDLTGLVPTPEETQAFVNDNSPNAYEKVVDRLLASTSYGERWARHWLDIARYADSNGYKADETRQNIWRYRDYVIQAFNDDKPYDRFILEQFAGDVLGEDAATGFLVAGPHAGVHRAAHVPALGVELLLEPVHPGQQLPGLVPRLLGVLQLGGGADRERPSVDAHPERRQQHRHLGLAVLPGHQHQHDPEAGPAVRQQLPGVDHQPFLPGQRRAPEHIPGVANLIKPDRGIGGQLTKGWRPQPWLGAPA